MPDPQDTRKKGERYEGRDMLGHIRIYTVGGDSWNAPCSDKCGCNQPDWDT